MIRRPSAFSRGEAMVRHQDQDLGPGHTKPVLDSAQMRQHREATVREHMEAENAHEFDRCIAAFSHPRYEIVATGEVWDGHSGVTALLNENKKGFPNFRFDQEVMHHSDSAVIVEGRFRGTHDGSWRGLPATGRKVDFSLIIV